MRKGNFTYELTGYGFNSCPVKASGEKVEKFCADYNLPMQKSYSTFLFEEHGAITMAKAFKSKMEYFYTILLEQPADPYAFTPEEIAGWAEPEDFRRLYHEFTDPHRQERAAEIHNLRPV